jgi:cytochrome P450
VFTAVALHSECVSVVVRAGDGSSPARPYDASDLGSLPLLTAVIKEGLRLLPPTPLGGVRVCTADDTQLCGHNVPKVGHPPWQGLLIATGY